jgi:hypothetical protein
MLQTEYLYRRWPKIREAEACSVYFYAALNRTREENLAELRLYEGWEALVEELRTCVA